MLCVVESVRVDDNDHSKGIKLSNRYIFYFFSRRVDFCGARLIRAMHSYLGFWTMKSA